MKVPKKKSRLFKSLNNTLNNINASSGQKDVNKIVHLSQQSSKSKYQKNYNRKHKKMIKKKQTSKSSIPPIINSRVLETTLVYALLKLYRKSSCKFIYKKADEHKSANDISYSFDFCSLRTLLGLKLAKVKSYHISNKRKGKVICRVKLTSLGKIFVRYFFLKHQWLIQKLRHYQSSQIIIGSFRILGRILIYAIMVIVLSILGACVSELYFGVIVLLLYLFMTQICPSNMINYIFIILNIIIALVPTISIVSGLGVGITDDLFHTHYGNVISGDNETLASYLRLIARTATRKQITQFFKQHHVKIPNYKFHMQPRLPSLCDSICTNRKNDSGISSNQSEYRDFQYKIKKMGN